MSHSHGHGNCDGHSHSHGGSSNGSQSELSNPPPRRGQTRRQEQMMSFGWFIGLHLPILYALLTGNTTLHYSIWPDHAIPTTSDPAAAEMPAESHPPSRGIGYAIVFFIWLTLTWIMYFTAALSYPGFVDTEFQRRKTEPTTDEIPQKNSRNGYARVNEEEEMKHGVDEVRLDVLSPRVVDERIAAVDEVNVAVAPSAAISPKGPGSIPASLVGEAAEAADLSVGCAPPVAFPLLKTLGLSRDQIHAADQTAEEDERSLDLAADETESSRLTASSSSSSSSTSIQMGTINRSPPTILPSSASSSASAAAAVVNVPPAPTEPLGSMLVSRSVEYNPPTAYCSMCRLVKPDRSKHCYKCRHCVQKFDHHCPFVANCIGAHNHRYFLIYLWLQMTTMMWGMVLNIEPYYYEYTPKEFYGHASVMCIMIMQLMVSGMLCMFHTWLAITNQTTYQVIKMQDAAATLAPDSLARRHAARRTRNRVNGDSSDEDEDDFTPGSRASKLKWDTYHVGFFRNMFTFCLGRLPDEHALPRSIVDGRDWVHLPHQFETVERLRKDGTVVRATADEMWAMKVRSLEEDSNNPGPIHESTVVHLSMNGVQLPTNAAELAAFPDTPPMEPIEAYTRPIRIIGKSKVGANRNSSASPAAASSSSSSSSSSRKIEPDTDEEVETSSVRL